MSCQPFSIMRLTHEAIRAGLNELEAINNQLSQDTVGNLKATFDGVKRAIELHANQEDNAFYPPLEAKRPKLTDAFSEEHEAEHRAFEQLSRQMNESSDRESAISEVQQSMRDWITQHRAHLQHEEDILMKVLPIAFTYVESVDVVRGILAYDLQEYEAFHLSWVFERLKEPQRKVYLGMLQGCSPEGKFPDFVAIVRPYLSLEEGQAFKEAG
jgi:hemerythrin-like domain-containing protein